MALPSARSVPCGRSVPTSLRFNPPTLPEAGRQTATLPLPTPSWRESGSEVRPEMLEICRREGLWNPEDLSFPLTGRHEEGRPLEQSPVPPVFHVEVERFPEPQGCVAKEQGSLPQSHSETPEHCCQRLSYHPGFHGQRGERRIVPLASAPGLSGTGERGLQGEPTSLGS